MVFLSLTHLLFTSAVLFLAILTIIKKKSMLAFVIIGFVVFDSFGIGIAPYLSLESIEYLTNPVFLINDGNFQLYTRQVLCHWIFLGIALLALIIEAYYKPAKKNYYIKKNRLYVCGLFFLSIGLVFYVRYFMWGPGLDLLLNTRLSFESTVEAIAARSIVRDTVKLRQGAWLASIASQILFPLAAFCFLKSKRKFRMPTTVLLLILSFLYAFQTRQKAPILAVVLIYTLLWITTNPQNQLRTRAIIKKFAIPALILGITGGIFLYSINFGLPISTSVKSLAARLLLIPGATETNFFAVFPDYFGYRGLLKILSIPPRYSDNDIGIYEIAFAATGYHFSSNASFLAVAWSGGGYMGVLMISIILIICLLLIDSYLKKIDLNSYYSILALSSYSILGLVSGSLSDYVNKGGLVIPMIVIGIYWSMKFVLKSTPLEESLSQGGINNKVTNNNTLI